MTVRYLIKKDMVLNKHLGNDSIHVKATEYWTSELHDITDIITYMKAALARTMKLIASILLKTYNVCICKMI